MSDRGRSHSESIERIEDLENEFGKLDSDQDLGTEAEEGEAGVMGEGDGGAMRGQIGGGVAKGNGRWEDSTYLLRRQNVETGFLSVLSSNLTKRSL